MGVRIVRRTALFVAAAFVVVLTVLLALLAAPGVPDGCHSLRFESFIPLPGRGIVQILDYLTIYRRQLFVTNVGTGDVYRIALPTKARQSAAKVFVLAGEPAAHGVVIDPVSGTGFVTRSGANTVDAFDPSTMRPIRRIAVADDPDAILYDPTHRLVYAVNGESMVATLIDPAKLKTVARISLGGSAEYAVFDRTTGLIYQNLASTNAVAAVDVVRHAVVWRYPLTQCEFPTGMAIDEQDRRLFIACGKSARLTIFDPDRRHVVANVPIGIGPDSVAYDAELRRIYTTGLMGTLSVIRQDTADAYSFSDTIRLHFNAHTLTIDPVTHNLFVGYTGFIAQPKLAEFSPIR